MRRHGDCSSDVNSDHIMLILILLIVGFKADTQFVAVSEDDLHVSIPGSTAIARDIGLNYTARDTNMEEGEVVTADKHNMHQYHSINRDFRGSYYRSKSVVTQPCHIEETSDYFYQPIPRVFTVGSAAFIPCLVTGIPTPNKTIQRCKTDECEVYEEFDFPDFSFTTDNHVIIRGVRIEDAGWYRCSGRNACGKKITSPVKLVIREEEESSKLQSGYILSRQTRDFSLTPVYTDIYGHFKQQLHRTLTDYQMWQLNPEKPGYRDEVFFMQEDLIYHFYYPIAPYPTGYNAQPSEADFLPDNIYGSVFLNSSCFTNFNQLTFITEFSTQVHPPPIVTPPVDHVTFTEQSESSIIFDVVTTLSAIDTTHVMCFMNLRRLRDNWRTFIRLEGDQIAIRLSNAKSVDSGYYQCGIKYDILYIGSPVFAEFPPSSETTAVANITFNCTELTWTKPTNYSSDSYLVMIARRKPNEQNHSGKPVTTEVEGNSVLLSNLTPYSDYTWHVTSLDLTPITDSLSFTTLRAIPTASPGNISVERHERKLDISWVEYPQEQWYDDHVYFTVSVDQVEVLRTYERAVTISELEPAHTYQIAVSACNSVGCSGNQTRVSLTTQHVHISAAPLVVVKQVGLHWVVVTVDVQQEGVSAYLQLFIGLECGEEKDGLMEIGVRGSKISHLNAYTRYSTRVKSSNGYSDSPWSPCLPFTTRFDWSWVIIPAVSLVFILTLTALLRTIIRSRCPDLVDKVRQALETRYQAVLPGEDWETSPELTIIHTQPTSDTYI